MNVEREHLQAVMREVSDLLGLQPDAAKKLIMKNTTLVSGRCPHTPLVTRFRM